MADQINIVIDRVLEDIQQVDGWLWSMVKWWSKQCDYFNLLDSIGDYDGEEDSIKFYDNEKYLIHVEISGFIPETLKLIKESKKAQNRLKLWGSHPGATIVFYHAQETEYENHIIDLIEYFDELGVDPSSLCYVSGNLRLNEFHELRPPENWPDAFAWDTIVESGIKLRGHSMFAALYAYLYFSQESVERNPGTGQEMSFSIKPHTKLDRSKRFVFYNAVPRHHRVLLYVMLRDSGLLEESYHSFLWHKSGARHNYKWTEDYIGAFAEKPALLTRLARTLEQDTLEPMGLVYDQQSMLKFCEEQPSTVLDIDTRDGSYFIPGTDRPITNNITLQQRSHQNNLSGHYEDSYFSIVSECVVPLAEHDPGMLEHMKGQALSIESIPQLFITEKTWKPIARYHPFIIHGCYGTLVYLKCLGYETFPEFFDESYDTEEDPIERLKLIVENIQRLVEMPKHELAQLFQSVIPKLEHNRNLFLTRDYTTDLREFFESCTN